MDKEIKNIHQKNESGANISGDYVGGDKIANALIGKIVENITNLSITSGLAYRSTEKDIEKYKEIIPNDLRT